MQIKECHLIQELLPLYAEDLINKETAEYIEEHLAGCISCGKEWESFIKPLLDPLSGDKLTPPEKSTENILFKRIKKTVIAAVLLLAMGGTGIALASYTAGKHVGQDDPSYRFAQELGLFTEINQSKTVDGIQVNVENGLFDSTRSVLFINFSSPVKDIPQLSLLGDDGQQYEQKSSKVWQNKYFMFELEPLALDTQSINVSLVLGDQEEDSMETAEFTIPVDVLKTAQYTKIIYPNQEKDLSNLKISLGKAVLGVSESEFEVRFDWPVDGSVAGFGIGRGIAYFPTSVTQVPDISPPPGAPAPPPGGLMSSYAASYGVNYRMEDPPENRPALYDLTVRQEVEVEWGEYKTTQFPCQVIASLKFAPVERETEQLELLLPPVYLYEKVANSPKLQINFQENNELNLEMSIPIKGGKVILEKIWQEKNSLYLSYRMESSDKPDTVVPHFELTDTEGMKQGEPRFDQEKPQVIIFHLYNDEIEELFLNLDSIGNLLPREKFTLHL